MRTHVNNTHKRLVLLGSRIVFIALLSTSLILSTTTITYANTYGDIIITEVMYDTNTSGDPDEWIELYNPGDSSIDVGGWVLTDDDSYSSLSGEGQCTIPSSTTIPAGGFLVVSKSNNTGIAGAVQCSTSGTFALANSGDNLALYNSSDQLVFGSLSLKHPDSASEGDSIGLKDPMAGWSSASSDWATETTVDSSNSRYDHHTAGGENDGWSGNVTTYHDITADGTVNEGSEWLSGDELGTVDSVTYYVTWKSDFIFVGMVGGNTGSDKYNVLIDIDPLDTGSDNSGTTSEYCGATFPDDGKPDYALQWNPSETLKEKAQNDGSSWETWSPSDSGANEGTNQVEFYIQKSDLGLSSSDPVALYLYACNDSNRVWSSWPPENTGYTGSVEQLTTRVRFDGTVDNRAPRDEAAHIGIQTLSADSTGNKQFFDDYVNLNVTTAGSSGCQVSVEVLANHLVSQFDGGVRRSYKIAPDGCSGLVADLTLKYEDGTANSAPDELRGLVESDLNLYRWTGSTWSNEGKTGNVNTANNKVTLSSVSTFSTWSFGTAAGSPTAITLSAFAANAHSPALLVASVLLLGAVIVWRRRRA